MKTPSRKKLQPNNGAEYVGYYMKNDLEDAMSPEEISRMHKRNIANSVNSIVALNATVAHHEKVIAMSQEYLDKQKPPNK